MKSLKDFIVVFDNAITPALCDSILEEYKESDNWVTATTGDGERLHVRNCRTIGISFSSIIEKNKEARLRLDKYMHVTAGEALKKYKKLFSDCEVIMEDSGYDLLRYETGGFYTQHVDSFKQIPRTISCSFILNDDYEGGEFAFFDRELVYKLKKGSCIMFPSNFMYPHEIMPVTSGTRYSIVTWFI